MRTDCAFRLNLRRDPTGNYQIMPSEHLEYNYALNEPQPPDLPESIKSGVRAMTPVGVERRSILAAFFQMVVHVPIPQLKIITQVKRP
jgi:hypothetical protein